METKAKNTVQKCQRAPDKGGKARTQNGKEDPGETDIQEVKMVTHRSTGAQKTT
jgi:hypothetical protein